MDDLRCKSPQRVHKEVAVHLLPYNLVQAVTARAASLTHLLPGRLSFGATLQVFNAFEEKPRHGRRARLQFRHVIVLGSIAQPVLSVRPNCLCPEPSSDDRKPSVIDQTSPPRGNNDCAVSSGDSLPPPQIKLMPA